MNANELMNRLAAEIADLALRIDSAQIDGLCAAILKAKRIFVSGRGRSGYISKCFAMRLTHLGLTCYCIDETNTPAVAAGDIVVICSGSGETEALVAMGRHCLRIGAELALVTANAESSLAELAGAVLVIPAYTSKLKNSVPTEHIMGGQFEDSMLLALDTCAIVMQRELGTTEDEMMRLHKNIE